MNSYTDPRGRVMTDGPTPTDFCGELDHEILCCSTKTNRCKHLGVHDGHYFFCSAQDAPNQHEERNAYPWKGAGKQLRLGLPDDGCPYLKERMNSDENISDQAA